jgi:SAM-dependent methyltransferase
VQERPGVTIVNLEAPAGGGGEFGWVIADARRLPFRDGAFDVVFANSTIEHVGDDDSRRQFAQEVQRVGKRYYVQTPYRWFPVEPHLMTPFIHYLPPSWRRRLLRNFTVWGRLVRPTPQGVDEFVRDVRLLDLAEMRRLFPASEIWRERFLGFTKSLIAVPRGVSPATRSAVNDRAGRGD